MTSNRMIYPQREIPGVSAYKYYSEVYTVSTEPLGDTDVYFIELPESIVSPPLVDLEIRVTGFSLVDTKPLQLQFSKSNDAGYLYFHKSAAGRDVVASYYGSGTPLRATAVEDKVDKKASTSTYTNTGTEFVPTGGIVTINGGNTNQGFFGEYGGSGEVLGVSLSDTQPTHLGEVLRLGIIETTQLAHPSFWGHDGNGNLTMVSEDDQWFAYSVSPGVLVVNISGSGGSSSSENPGFIMFENYGEFRNLASHPGAPSSGVRIYAFNNQLYIHEAGQTERAL